MLRKGDIAPEQKDYPEREVASVAVFNPDGKLLFGLRRDDGKWSLPGGHLEPDERPERCAARELLEEVGLIPESETLKALGNDVVTGWRGDTIRVHAFRCNIPPGQDVKFDNDPDGEFHDHEWVDPEFIPSYILENLHSPKNVVLRMLGLQDWNEVEEGPEQPLGEVLAPFQAPHLQMQVEPVAHPATTFKSELQKGVATKRWPSEGNREGKGNISDETYGHAADWVGLQDKDAREGLAVEGMPHEDTQRLLHGLHGSTQVRIDPKTQKREFLLHRGMGDVERNRGMSPDGKRFATTSASSWTPNLGIAQGFNRPGGVVSAWVPEHHIRFSPTQAGHDSHSPEEEVIVPNMAEFEVHQHYPRKVIGPTSHYDRTLPGNVDARVNALGDNIQRRDLARQNAPASITDTQAQHQQEVKHVLSYRNKPVFGKAEPEAPQEEFDHYSPMRGLKRLDPSMQGTGAFGLHGGEAQRQNRIPRTYLYHAGTEPESTFKAGQYQKYRAKLPKGWKLYDIGKDPEGYMRPKWRQTDEGRIYEPADLDEVERKIRKKYHGYKNYHPTVPNAVAVFYPLDVKPLAKSARNYPSAGEVLEKTDVETLMQHPARAERMMALKLPGVTQADVRRGVEDPDAQVALAALKHALVDPEVLTQALAHSAPNVRIEAARHPLADATHIEQALADTNPLVRRALATSPNLEPDQLQQLLDGGDPEVLEGVATNPALTQDQAVAILVNPGVSAATKALVAEHPHLPAGLRKAVGTQLDAGFAREAQEWLLQKDRTTPTFPKMGLGDNPRETPVIHTPREFNIKNRAVVNAVRTNGRADQAEQIASENASDLGATYTGPGAGTGRTNIAYSKDAALRGVKHDPKNINTWVSSNPRSGQSTKPHEDLHQMLNRVNAKYGPVGRLTFAHNLYHSIPKHQREYVDTFMRDRAPTTRVTHASNGQLEHEHPYPFEERMALMLNYLNNPGERAAYHTCKGHTPEAVQEFGTQMKRAHNSLLTAAAVAPADWARSIQPWARGRNLAKAEYGHVNGMPGAIDTPDQHNPDQSYESVSAEGAHQPGNAIRGQDGGSHDLLPLADPDFVADFEGHHLDEDQVFEAARFLSGGKARLAPEDMRRFVWEEDGDRDAAALRAYGMEPDEEHRLSLQGILSVVATQQQERKLARPSHFAVHNEEERLGKGEQNFEPQDRPRTPGSIVAGTASADGVAEAVRAAFRHKRVEAIQLKGKHSKGTLVAHDPDSDDVWLLKPGSGSPSPAAGIRETQGSQSAREACFYACAKTVFGLGDSVPKCELLLIDGKPVAAMQFLPPEFRSLEKRAKEDSMHVLWSLHSYLKTGTLHKWAVLDGILGNVDRHGQNILADNGQPERMYLIDHGSAFAGNGFNPGHDRSSFVAYYLRAWSPRKFNTLDPEEKLRRLPRADAHVEALLRDWVNGLHADALETIMARFGLDPGPCLRRLAKLKTTIREGTPVDLTINRMWVGLDSWETSNALAPVI
jgi:8-oxo-dGTP pyrophosphatase MutT (NUDIX family)